MVILVRRGRPLFGCCRTIAYLDLVLNRAYRQVDFLFYSVIGPSLLLDLRIRRLRYACGVTIRPECSLLACSSPPMRGPIRSPSCLLVDRCIRQNVVLRLPFHVCMPLASYRTDIHQFVPCFHLPTGSTIGISQWQPTGNWYGNHGPFIRNGQV
ncbi:uncharacterized protein EI90DRAFT_839866 [Cantharellus anzutake]|uniref:uncharacterized protein n=1 Tax=Cantharellus anzutake TaxID=1750568 RepID=UPI00190509AB|nr:uncharacterized protein EI90DRAFT_839866 [Cantharellus anzutake]KAF8332242.1 hypothetical protein EI90DRAFT_839866 [Cantharellus anzutake]